MIVGAVLSLAACARAPQLTYLPTDAVMVAFGDSLTYGTGAAPQESYPAVLAALTGRRVINAGEPGETSAEGLKRLPHVLDQHRPALVLLCHGGNDLLARADPASLENNLRAMMQLAAQRGIAVVLIGVPNPKLFRLKAAALYPTLTDDFDAVYEGEILAKIESDPALKSDLIHPNAAGYRLLAETLHEILESAGAL